MRTTGSLNALRATLKEQVDMVFLNIAKVEHSSFGSPYLFVSDKKDLVRADGTYSAFGFSIQLPDDDEENIRSVNFVIPIVSPALVAALRSIDSEFTVTYSVVTLATPDTVEFGPFVFLSDGMVFEKTYATVSLIPNRNIAVDAFPKDAFTPSNKP